MRQNECEGSEIVIGVLEKGRVARVVKEPATRARELVYFIRSGEAGPIKIGFTDGSPWKRLVALQIGNPERLALIAVAKGGYREERWLHRRFAGRHIRGEWFEPCAELLGLVAALPPLPDEFRTIAEQPWEPAPIPPVIPVAMTAPRNAFAGLREQIFRQQSCDRSDKSPGSDRLSSHLSQSLSTEAAATKSRV